MPASLLEKLTLKLSNTTFVFFLTEKLGKLFFWEEQEETGWLNVKSFEKIKNLKCPSCVGKQFKSERSIEKFCISDLYEMEFPQISKIRQKLLNIPAGSKPRL